LWFGGFVPVVVLVVKNSLAEGDFPLLDTLGITSGRKKGLK